MDLSTSYVILLFVVTAGMIASVRAGKLTLWGAVLGGILGLLIFCGAGWTGISLLTAFFLLGTAATSWKQGQKERLGLVEENKGKRRASQVFANGGVAAILGLINYLYPKHPELLQAMIAASFSSAAADTISSELGSLYGKRFYNILSFKTDKRGLDGVVSIEGTVAGVAASIVIASIYTSGFGWNINFLWIIIAGTAGNLIDSLLGALLERKGLLHNDVVNFLNTLAAAIVCLVLMMYA